MGVVSSSRKKAMFADLVRMLILINRVRAKTKAQAGGVAHIVVLQLRTNLLFVFCNNVCKKPLCSTGVYKYCIFHDDISPRTLRPYQVQFRSVQ